MTDPGLILFTSYSAHLVLTSVATWHNFHLPSSKYASGIMPGTKCESLFLILPTILKRRYYYFHGCLRVRERGLQKPSHLHPEIQGVKFYVTTTSNACPYHLPPIVQDALFAQQLCRCYSKHLIRIAEEPKRPSNSRMR